jgi:hypothetical protein
MLCGPFLCQVSYYVMKWRASLSAYSELIFSFDWVIFISSLKVGTTDLIAPEAGRSVATPCTPALVVCFRTRLKLVQAFTASGFRFCIFKIIFGITLQWNWMCCDDCMIRSLIICRLSGPQGRSGSCGEEKNHLPLPGVEPRSSSL